MSEERAGAGFAAEIAYYLDHHLDGSDRERLERLRDRCAEELRRALALPDLDHATARRAMLAALEFRPYPDVLPALGELRERDLKLVVASNWDCSLPEWLGPTGIMELVDGVVTSAEVGAAKPDPRVFERALAIAGVEPPGRSTWETSSTTTWRAPVRPECARFCFSGRATRRPAWRPSPRFGSSPPYSDWPWSTPPSNPRRPRRLPELPEGAGPRWPPWYAGVGFLVALIATLVVVGIVAAATGASTDDDNPTFTVLATFLQGVIFIGTAVLFASFAGKPQARHFGLRPSRFWPTVGWAALGLVSFYLLATFYGAIVQPDVEQTVAQDLGADEGTLGLIAAGFMVICVAPVAEEFFFRGFFYRALRSRYSILAAALIDGLCSA